jgi:hypothetical protein
VREVRSKLAQGVQPRLARDDLFTQTCHTEWVGHDRASLLDLDEVRSVRPEVLLLIAQEETTSQHW